MESRTLTQLVPHDEIEEKLKIFYADQTVGDGDPITGNRIHVPH